MTVWDDDIVALPLCARAVPQRMRSAIAAIAAEAGANRGTLASFRDEGIQEPGPYCTMMYA